MRVLLGLFPQAFTQNAKIEVCYDRLLSLDLSTSTTYSSCFSENDFRADEKVTIQDKIPLPELSEGTFYLYCKESGSLFDAMPIKDAYWVMIFPHM
jgi:hypothetical protein